jgi:trehalose/maltose transport system substrate-binding protein
MNVFDSGQAAFNRVWLGTGFASGPSSQVYWRNLEPRVETGFTALPGGPGGSGGILGGSGLAVSRHSAHPQEAVKLVHFLIRAQIESIEKRNASDNQPEFYKVPAVSDAYRHSEKAIKDGSPVVHRPSIETGSQYMNVSKAYLDEVHSVLTGEKGAPQAAAELEKQLIKITGFRTGPPKVGN